MCLVIWLAIILQPRTPLAGIGGRHQGLQLPKPCSKWRNWHLEVVEKLIAEAG